MYSSREEKESEEERKGNIKEEKPLLPDAYLTGHVPRKYGRENLEHAPMPSPAAEYPGGVLLEELRESMGEIEKMEIEYKEFRFSPRPNRAGEIRWRL